MQIANRRAIIFGVSPLLLVATLHIVSQFTVRFYTNRSDSLPMGFYHSIEKNVPDRGDIVAFTPPKTVLDKIKSGELNAYEIFFKRVAALPGDHVCFTHNLLSVGHQANWPIRPDVFEKTGLVQQTFCGPIPPEHLLLLSDNIQHGFDSRYYGLVHTSHIKDVIVPL